MNTREENVTTGSDTAEVIMGNISVGEVIIGKTSFGEVIIGNIELRILQTNTRCHRKSHILNKSHQRSHTRRGRSP